MAGTTSSKLQGILNSKEDIRKAIVSKGVSCDENVALSSYASKIRSIQQSSGTGAGMTIPGKVVSATHGTCQATQLKITEQPQNISGASNTFAHFCVVAQGEGLKYQWQTKPSSSSTWSDCSYSGNSTSMCCLTITSSTSGLSFRCLVTDKSGNTVTSNPATLTQL